MTREEAVAWLQERGVGARQRETVYGPSVLVYDREENTGGPTLLVGAVVLYRELADPEAWILDLMYTPGPAYTTHATLLDACEAARRHIETQRSRR